MAHPTQQDKENRSLGELFGELSQETTTLVRQEVALAKAELSQKASEVGKDIGFLAAGGAVAYAGLLAIIAAAIFALANAVPTWLSALIVGVVVIAVGAFLVFRGIDNLKKEGLAPQRTIQSIQEDTTWAKTQTK